MPQDEPPPSTNRLARMPALVRRLGGRAIPVVGTGLLVVDALCLIHGLIPEQTKIGNMIQGLDGRADDYAWSGEVLRGAGDGLETASIINDYWGDPSQLIGLQANAARSEILSDTARQIELQALPTGNEPLAETLQHRRDTAVGYINSAVAEGAPEVVQQVLEDDRAESARQEAEFQARSQQIPPLPSGASAEPVRVTGSCRPVRLCFWPATNARRQPLRREFERQLEAKERVINADLLGDQVGNRQAFCNPTQRSANAAQAAASRTAARTAHRQALTQLYRPHARAIPNVRARLSDTAPIRARARMRSLAALHNPAMVAGGGPGLDFTPADADNVLAGRPICNFGHKAVNSSIGRSLGNGGSRSSRLKDDTRRQAANGWAGARTGTNERIGMTGDRA